MKETINIINDLCVLLNSDAHELAERIIELQVTERWLYQECKEPKRTEAIEWIRRYKTQESFPETEINEIKT